MPDASGKLRRAVAVLWPAVAIFVIWGVLDAIAGSQWLPSSITGNAWFPSLVALVLALTLASGWLVALSRLLHGRGRGRIVNAALALVFATLGIGSVVYDLRVGDVLIDGVGRFSEMQSRPQPKLPALFDRAWTGKDAATRQLVARTLYQLRGVRVAWQDETGAGRLFEPTPEMVRKNEQRLRAEETLRALNILFADHAAYRFRDLCAHFIGVVVMLLGSLVLCARSRAAPGTSPPPPPGPHPIDS